MTDDDAWKVTIEFASYDKAQAFREHIGKDGGTIRWDRFDDVAYALVWIEEETSNDSDR